MTVDLSLSVCLCLCLPLPACLPVSLSLRILPKWCTYSAVWLLHSWCHKNCCRLGALCVHHTFTHAPRHIIMWQRHIRRVHACLAGTCHCTLGRMTGIFYVILQYVTREWSGYRNKSQLRKFRSCVRVEVAVLSCPS